LVITRDTGALDRVTTPASRSWCGGEGGVSKLRDNSASSGTE